MANLAFVTIAVLMCLLAIWRPGVACGYTLAGFALEQCAQAFVPLAGHNDTLCNYLIAGCVLGGLVRVTARDGLASFSLRLPAILMLALLGYCYASFLWSIFPSVTQGVLNSQLPYLATFVALAPLLISRPEDLDDCITSLVMTSAVSLGALVLFGNWGQRGVLLPYSHFESNPLALTQAAGSLLIAAAVSPSLHKLQQPIKTLCVVGILAVVTLVFLRTASRGQIIAAVSTTFLFTGTRRGAAWAPIALLGIGGLIASGFLAEEVERNAARWDPEAVEEGISEGRVSGAQELIAFWSRSHIKYILLGLGHATARDPRVLGAYPHVVPAEVLGEEGLIGTCIYAATLLVAAFYYVRAIRAGAQESVAYMRTAAALCLYEFLLSLKQGSLLGQPSLLLLLVLSGVAVDARHRNASRGRPSEGSPRERRMRPLPPRSGPPASPPQALPAPQQVG